MKNISYNNSSNRNKIKFKGVINIKKSKLEEYLNKQVSIKLFDNETLTGTLRKTGAEYLKNTPELYLKENYYFIDYGCCDNSNYNKSLELLISCLFRSSHVKSLKSINN